MNNLKMKGKNILYGTGLYLLSLWALYGKKLINSEGQIRRVPLGHEGMRTDAWPAFRQEIANFEGDYRR